MTKLEEYLNLGPRSIAFAYVVFGGVWVTFSDRILDAMIVSRERFLYVQTIKGWVFVALSGLLVYGLVLRSRRTLERKNERLETAVQHTSILHRVLRHNLRNLCTVIHGYADILDQTKHSSVDDDACVDAIQSHTDELIEISEKASRLRRAVQDGGRERRPTDVAQLVDERVTHARSVHPDAKITTDVPDRAWASAAPELGDAIDELIENAIIHADSANPELTVRVVRDAQVVRIEIAEHGPGIPETERAVLQREMEEPLQHSTGLGLWIVRIIVSQLGGSLSVEDRSTGTVVSIVIDTEIPSGTTTQRANTDL